MALDPHLFGPRVTRAIGFQGDWQRAIEWSENSVSLQTKSDGLHWESLMNRGLHAQFLGLSGDDEQAISILQKVVQEMRSTMDPNSIQQEFDLLKTSYFLTRMMLFAGNEQQRMFAIKMLEAIRPNFNPKAPNHSVQIGFAISISQFSTITPTDLKLADEVVRLAENRLKSNKDNSPGLRSLSVSLSEDLEVLLGCALVAYAKGNRAEGVHYLKKLIETAKGQDIQIADRHVNEPIVCLPTLRTAEDTLVKWFCDDKRPDDAIQVLELAIQSREGHPIRAEHQINFAKARLGRLLIKLESRWDPATCLRFFFGTVNGRISASTGSAIYASGGTLEIGGASSVIGYHSDGELYTGGGIVVVNDANQANFGILTHLGDAGDDGFIIAQNGIDINFGENITGTIDGSFHTFDLPSLGEGLRWDRSDLYSNGTLSISAVPEPGSLGILLAMGLTFISRRRRTIKVGSK